MSQVGTASTRLLTFWLILRSTHAALRGGCFSKIDSAPITNADRYISEAWGSNHLILNQKNLESAVYCSAECASMPDCTAYSSYIESGLTSCDYVNANSMVVTSHLNNDNTVKVYAKTQPNDVPNDYVVLNGVPDNNFIRQLVPPAKGSMNTVESCSEYCNTNNEVHLGDSWNKCDFFVMLHGECNIGSLNYDDPSSQEHAVADRKSQVYFKKGVVNQSYFEPEFTPGSEWPKKIYKRLPMSMSAMEESYGLAECEAQCRLDLGPCHLFVYSWPECFLGDWNVDTEAVVKPLEVWEEKTVYGRQAVAALTFDGLAKEHDVSFDNVALERNQYCPMEGSMFGDSRKSSFGSSMAYYSPYLFHCGGAASGKDTCWRLNMEDKFLQEWESAATMPQQRGFFPFLTTGKDGYIYAFEGGAPWATEAHASILRYQVSSDSWSTALADTGYSSSHACGIIVEDKEFWIIGGQTKNSVGVETFHNRVQSYSFTEMDPPVPKAKPTLPAARFGAACGTIVDKTNGHTLVLVASGQDANKAWTDTLYYMNIQESNPTWQTSQAAMQATAYRANWPGTLVNFDKWSASLFSIDEASDGMSGDLNNFLRLDMEDMQFVRQPLPEHRYVERRDAAGVSVPLSAIWWTCNRMSEQEWTLILKQNLEFSLVNKRHFREGEWTSTEDADSTGAYINMTDMNRYKKCGQDKFHFRLVYPEFGYFNEWYQKNDPTMDINIDEYKPISVAYPNAFAGLRRSAHADYSLMTGFKNPNYNSMDPYQVGIISLLSNNGGPYDGSHYYPVNHIELYVNSNC